MKLNVGCGEFYRVGWTNMDLVRNKKVKPDLIGSLLDLPEEIQGVEQVYMGHILEHIHYSDLEEALRNLWSRCVKGALVGVVGPDCQRTRKMYSEGRVDAKLLNNVINGENRWHGDVHLWECDEASMFQILRDSGLNCRPVPLRSTDLNQFPVVSRVEWQCAVVGTV